MARNIDYSTRDYEGFRNDMINLLKQKVPEYTDFSESDLGVVLIELMAHGLDIVSFYNDIVANEVFFETAKERESVTKIANTLGYTINNATPSKFYQVFEIVPQASDFTITKGTKIMTKGDAVEEGLPFEVDEDLVIPAGDTGIETDVSEDYIHTVSITQGETISNEILGTSTGVADQRFKLGYKPAIVDSINIYVNQGRGLVKWNMVNNFLNSDRDARDYTVLVNEEDETYIQFGNGTSGKIPDPYINGIQATYRIGGGKRGNVAPMTIIDMKQKPQSVVQTFNPEEAYEVGINKDSIETIKAKATAYVRTLGRAVTLQDFKDLALTVPFVKLSNAIENEVEVTVDVHALSESGDTLTTEEVDYLTEYVDERVLLGTEFRILSPEYNVMNLEVSITTYSEYTNTDVQSTVEGFIESYFEVGNIDFGETVTMSGIITMLSGIDSVKSVSIVSPVADVDLAETELPSLGTLTVTVTGGIE